MPGLVSMPPAARPRAVWRLACVLALVVGLAQPRSAAACSCVAPSPPAVAFTEMPAVFSGTVTHIGTAGVGGLAGWLEPLRRWLGLAPMTNAFALSATVQVITAWKGVTTTPVSILTAAGSASCGYAFAVGQSYVIYAFDGPEGLNTNICSRTAELGQAAADLAFLQSMPPLAVTPAGGAGDLARLGLVLVLLIATAALAGLWVWRVWRRPVSPST